MKAAPINIHYPETASFIAMKDGTREDYLMLREQEHAYLAGLPDRIMTALQRLDEGINGYKVSRLGHSLQSATRAEADGADSDWVVAALVHDIGDDLAPMSHDSMAASVLKPFVREQVTWVIQHHGIFQAFYYAHHYGEDRNAREKYKSSPYYHDCVDFCEFWDQNAFDPDFPTKNLEHFAPLVSDVFSRAPWDSQNLKAGTRVALKNGS